MPKKGKKNAEESERENDKQWKQLKNRHSAVESDINCLEHHGLDRCPDKGLHGFKRYAGLGVLAYNLHRIGSGLQKMEEQRKKRKAKQKPEEKAA